MSGKFMKVRKLIIPTITMVIIASQLMGCAAASQSELLQMINQGDSIEIEIAEPAFAEAELGTETSILWEQLALLQTNPDLRSAWDDTLGITNTDTGKNGILYVDVDGNNDNNNTLRVALHNREFVKALESETTVGKLADASASNYVDLEADETMKSVYAGINGYFNLLPDNEVNYCNADSTLHRNEFMAMVMRAETPVTDELTSDTAFNTAVGQNDLNIYAQSVADNSYLDIASKSLNNMTYNGSISRAEAIYLVVNRYFADELAAVDTAAVTFTDAKDGGDIATLQKFIEDGTTKDYWKSYELTYAIQNPNEGLPTDLFKALVVAKQQGLITDETRWDEAITRAEAVELLVSTYMVEDGIPEFNAKQGIIEGYEVSIEETEEESDGNGGVDSTLEEDEYDEVTDNVNTTPKKSLEDIDLNHLTKEDVMNLSEEELKELEQMVIQEILNGTGDGTGGHLEGNPPPEGFVESSGELPGNTFGQGDHGTPGNFIQ